MYKLKRLQFQLYNAVELRKPLTCANLMPSQVVTAQYGETSAE